MNTRMKIVLAGALIAAASGANAQTSETTVRPSAYDIQSTADDQRITNDIEAKIANDPRLSGTVGVETVNGTVTLKGLVATDGQAERAGRDAESVEGVREVDNETAALVGKNF